MKNIYSILRKNYLAGAALMVLALMGSLPYQADAQVLVPFTQRTSVYTPSQTIYSVNGNFTMIGNTI